MARVVLLVLLMIMACSAGCIDERGHHGPPENPEPTWVYGEIIYEERRLANTLLLDGTFEIDTVRVGAVEAIWVGSTASVRLHGTNERINDIPLEPYPGNPEDGFHVYFLERAGSPLGPDVGDAVIVNGITRDMGGAHFSIGGNFQLEIDPLGYWSMSQRFKITTTDPSILVPNAGIAEWDVMMTVLSIEPEWEEIPWSWVLMDPPRVGERVPFEELTPGEVFDRTQPAAYFLDGTVNDGVINPGDVIRLTGVPHWTGDRVRFDLGRDSITSFVLPGLFPSVLGTAQFGDPVLTERRIAGSVYSAINVEVVNISTEIPAVPLDDCLIFLWSNSFYETSHWHPFNNNPRTVTERMGWVTDSDGDRMVSPGDIIHLIGLTSSRDERYVSLMLRQDEVCTVKLPPLFPGENASLSFDYDRNISSRWTQNGTVWDAEFKIKSVDAYYSDVQWWEVNISVRDKSDSRYVMVPRPLVEDIGVYDDSPRAWYNTSSTNSSRMKVGDRILITGMGHTFQGGFFHLEYNGIGLGKLGIGTSFEQVAYHDPVINIDPPEVELSPIDNITFWKIQIQVNNVTWGEEDIPWSKLRLSITSWNGTTLLDSVSLKTFPPQEDEEWDGYNSHGLSVWYWETYEVNGLVDDYDYIGITGVTNELAGARLEFSSEGRFMAAAILPGTFPGPLD